MKARLKRWLNPTTILAIFIFLAPWQTRYIFGLSYLSGDPTQFGILSVYATQVFLVLGLAGAYLVAGLPVLARRYRASLLIGIAIYLVAIISGFLAEQSIPALAALIDLLGAGVFFTALLDERVNLKWVMSAFVAGLLIPVGLGLIQVVSGTSGASTLLGLAARDANHLGDVVTSLADGTRILRAYGPFPHPNIFGGYLAIGILSALALQFQRRRSLVVIVTILSVGLLLTLSRSAILGLLLGGLLSRLAQRPTWRPALMPIACVVVAVALGITLFAPQLAASLRGGGTLEDRSLSERANQYHAWPSTMHGSDWIIGNGPRDYVFALADAHPGQTVWDYQPIHNVPFLILSELGLIGFILILAWVILLDRQNFQRFPNRDAAYAHGLGKVLFVIIFFDHYLWSSWAGLVLVAYVGALMLRLGEDKVDIDLD